MNIETNYPDHNYMIHIEADALNKHFDFSHYDARIALVDEYVLELHESVINEFAGKHHIEVIKLPQGEQVKSLESYAQMSEVILSRNITRKSVLFAIGGGAAGDFTGFIASTVLRGIDFIQVPTTILAHDSAIGGKCGINSMHGKNLIGAFKRPQKVIYDLNFLSTLSDVEILSGFGEVIKHVLLKNDAEATKKMMHQFQSIVDIKDLNQLEHYLNDGIKTKLDIVIKDEYESGVRQLLNFGHTFGHALEFEHKLPHGHAVLLGMIYAMILSRKDQQFLISFIKWSRQLGYSIPIFHEFEKYLNWMQKDKKNTSGHIRFVLCEPDFHVTDVDSETLTETFEQLKLMTGSNCNETYI